MQIVDKERIREILADNICVGIEQCVDSALLNIDIVADSLSLLSFAVELSEEAGIYSDEDDLFIISDIKTIGQLIDRAYNYVITATDSQRS